MVSSIHCRYRAMHELSAPAWANADRWLSPAERETYCGLRSPDRRLTWLAGRLVAKQVVVACWKEVRVPGPAEIHIESRSPQGRLGQRPRVFVFGEALDWSISIAHSARGVLVAVATRGGVSLGVDLVMNEECSARLLEWCFTPNERRWLAAAPVECRGPERLWAMKEAVFKACQRGEGFAPERIETIANGMHCDPASLSLRKLQSWLVDGHVAALAVADPIA